MDPLLVVFFRGACSAYYTVWQGGQRRPTKVHALAQKLNHTLMVAASTCMAHISMLPLASFFMFDHLETARDAKPNDATRVERPAVQQPPLANTFCRRNRFGITWLLTAHTAPTLLHEPAAQIRVRIAPPHQRKSRTCSASQRENPPSKSECECWLSTMVAHCLRLRIHEDNTFKHMPRKTTRKRASPILVPSYAVATLAASMTCLGEAPLRTDLVPVKCLPRALRSAGSHLHDGKAWGVSNCRKAFAKPLGATGFLLCRSELPLRNRCGRANPPEGALSAARNRSAASKKAKRGSITTAYRFLAFTPQVCLSSSRRFA